VLARPAASATCHSPPPAPWPPSPPAAASAAPRARQPARRARRARTPAAARRAAGGSGHTAASPPRARPPRRSSGPRTPSTSCAGKGGRVLSCVASAPAVQAVRGSAAPVQRLLILLPLVLCSAVDGLKDVLWALCPALLSHLRGHCWHNAAQTLRADTSATKGCFRSTAQAQRQALGEGGPGPESPQLASKECQAASGWHVHWWEAVEEQADAAKTAHRPATTGAAPTSAIGDGPVRK